MSERLEQAAERMRTRIMIMPIRIAEFPDFFTNRIEVTAIAQFGSGKFLASIFITPEAQRDIPAKFIEQQLRASLCRLLIRDIAFIKPKGRLPN